MNLNQLVYRNPNHTLNELLKVHDNYDVLISDKEYTFYSQFDPWCDCATEIDDQYFLKQDLLSGVKELVEEEYIQNLLSNEWSVDPLLYVHLWKDSDEPGSSADKIIKHVFEVHVDIGEHFKPTEEEPYYLNYGEILEINER